jgi:hypothetical protein
VTGLTDAIEELSRKTGLVLLVVGLLHLVNVLILGHVRRERIAEGRRDLVEDGRWPGPYPAAPRASARR